ncbi:MAG: hypothetical protein ACRC5C_07440, partial [Bacilli bacterium]
FKANAQAELAKKKTAGKVGSLKDQKKAKGDTIIDEHWECAYAATRVRPPRKMTIEELRQSLELDYPELSYDRTTWEVDTDKKILIPIVTGSKKG